MGKSKGSGNSGIIGAVTAENVAVGDGASIAFVDSPRQTDRGTVDAALRELRQQLAALALSPAQVEQLQEDVLRLQRDAQGKADNNSSARATFESFLGKLKILGVLTESASKLAGPLKLVASWLGIALPK